jgi:hypothetical protein
MSDSGGGGGGSNAPSKLPEVTVSEHPVTPSLPMAQRAPADVIPTGMVWLRYWTLLLQQAAPKGQQTKTVDLSNLHLEFTVTYTAGLSRPHLTCRVFNVGKKLVNMLIQQYQVVVLSAGYRMPQGQYGEIFNGRVGYYRRGRMNAIDTFLEITGDAWSMEMQTATINTTLPAGHTPRDVLTQVQQSAGAVIGYVTQSLPTNGAPRGRTLYGQPADHLRDMNQSTDTHSFLGEDGKINTLGHKETLAGDAIKLNSQTGMVGVPTQELGGGIKVTTLLNPLLKVGRAVHINQDDITRHDLAPTSGAQQGSDPGVEPLGVLPQQQFKIDTAATVTTDGNYKVMEVRHQGDSRGNPWYTHLVCIPTAAGAQTGLPQNVAPPKVGIG